MGGAHVLKKEKIITRLSVNKILSIF